MTPLDFIFPSNINPPANPQYGNVALSYSNWGPFRLPETVKVDPLLNALNTIRTQSNLPPLQPNLRLNNSALAKATDLVKQGYWSHNTSQGELPWEEIKKAQYLYKVAGENLARGYKMDQKTIDAWLASPTHKANILSPKYSEIGIGRKKDKEGHEYVVTHFGKPK